MKDKQEIEELDFSSTQSQEKSKYSVKNIFLAILITCFPLVSFWIGRSSFFDNSNSNKEDIINVDTSIGNGDEKPKTGLSGLLNNDNAKILDNKIYPVTSVYKAFVQENKEGFIDVAPINKDVDSRTISKYGKKYSGGSLGLGSDRPVLAPDLEKFAFLEDDAVVITSADGKIEQKIELKNIEYINSWSPDSTKLLVYVLSNTIKDNLDFGAPGYQPPDQYPVDQDSTLGGFVLINFDKGTMRQMNELNDLLVYSWVGNDAFILSSGLGQNEYFVYYSMTDKIVDRKLMNNFSDTFVHQMSFTDDGKKWANVTATLKDSDGTARVTVGNFPNIGDISSMEFSGGMKQRPRLSPESTNVALMGYEVLNGPQYVYLYNGVLIEKITEGRPELWIDNNTLLFTNKNSVFTYNVMSKKITSL